MEQANPKRAWVVPLVVLGTMALGWLVLLIGLDYVVSYGGGSGGFWRIFSAAGAGELRDVLGNFPEVVVGILGIAITMVSFVLQLAATRYTPRVTAMFFSDRANLAVMGFFVVASVHCIWATVMVRRTFVPHILVFSSLAIMTMAILILIPYFSYVFAFLNPSQIVARLQAHALAEAVGGGSADADAIDLRQKKVLAGVEQLADVAVNSVSQKDRIIASGSVDALKDLVLGYLERKHSLQPAWFAIGRVLRQNPDFVAMAPQSVDEISQHGTWVEWKILRQYQTIYNESLNRMRDVNQLVAIDTRYIGEKAIAAGDVRVLELAVKFFNTYLRATINHRDVRTAYNVLHQYRLLAQALLHHAWNEQAVGVAEHFKYYGQLANTSGLAFVNETAAYDLCTLCEAAHDHTFPLERRLLSIFLEVDKVPENEEQEQSLRGVRKAQLKLATYYLVQGAQDLARIVWHDMEHERPERMLSIRQEMLAVQDEHFWEVIDRGHNFDYLDPRRREQLDVFYSFYSWFPQLDLGGEEARVSS